MRNAQSQRRKAGPGREVKDVSSSLATENQRRFRRIMGGSLALLGFSMVGVVGWRAGGDERVRAGLSNIELEAPSIGPTQPTAALADMPLPDAVASAKAAFDIALGRGGAGVTFLPNACLVARHPNNPAETLIISRPGVSGDVALIGLAGRSGVMSSGSASNKESFAIGVDQLGINAFLVPLEGHSEADVGLQQPIKTSQLLQFFSNRADSSGASFEYAVETPEGQVALGVPRHLSESVEAVLADPQHYCNYLKTR